MLKIKAVVNPTSTIVEPYYERAGVKVPLANPAQLSTEPRKNLDQVIVVPSQREIWDKLPKEFMVTDEQYALLMSLPYVKVTLLEGKPKPVTLEPPGNPLAFPAPEPFDAARLQEAMNGNVPAVSR